MHSIRSLNSEKSQHALSAMPFKLSGSAPQIQDYFCILAIAFQAHLPHSQSHDHCTWLSGTLRCTACKCAETITVVGVYHPRSYHTL